MRNIIILILLSIVFTVKAQKRNFVSSGVFYDYLLKYENTSSDELIFSNKTGYTVGYDRLIGNAVSVGIRYVRFFGTGTSGAEMYGGSENPTGGIDGIPVGYQFEGGVFEEKGGGFIYESKIFADDFDSDGANSSYLGILYSRLYYTESLNKIRISEVNNYSNIIDWKDISNNYVINRIGLKLGRIVSSDLGYESYIGGFYNFSDGKDDAFTSPTKLANFSFVIGIVFGVPF